MANDLAPPEPPGRNRRVDGRRLGSERTRQLIIEAYLDLLRESPEAPTAAPELSTLPEPEQKQLLIALEALTEFESWGRMRERHGLSIEAACEVWIKAIDQMLPPTPAES